MSMRRPFYSLALAGFLTVTGSAQAQQGTISGRVTDSLSREPIAAAQITVAGTNLGTQTNNEGEYTLRGVNTGQVEVRILRLGYAEVRRSATVTAGQTTTLNITLRPVAVSLNPVVTTATGQQRRIEVGNAIAQVDAAEVVQTQAVANLGDLLTSRAAGVQVLPGVQTGAGTRVRIRGTSSLSLTNNPIYIIDGIRVEGTTGSSTISVGGTTPARVGDLNPEEIESIEVVRGPSAATLYGTDAANGVIVITTKRGVAGRMEWTHYTEQTAITDQNDYPTAWRGWRTGTTSGTTSTQANTVQCFLTQVAAGTCSQDSVTSFNLHEDPETTPYGIGYRRQYGSQLRGGTETVRFFVHGEFEDEDGVTKVPDFDKQYMKEHGLSLRPEQKSPNRLTRMTGRTNLNIALPSNFDLGVGMGYNSQDLRLPMSDDSGVRGIATNVYGGPGHKGNVTPSGEPLFGWRAATPREIYQAQNWQGIERFIGSANSNWRAKNWLTARANVGLDLILRKDTQLCRFANCPESGQDRLGYKIDNRTNFYIYTVDAGATATHSLTDAIESKTTAGFQFYRNVFNRNGAEGRQLPPGATTVTSGAIKEADETSSESRTLGGFVEQSFAFRDRLFLTGAVRSDRNSAFGANFKTVFYPKFSASWVMSDEEFFPEMGWINQLRLRTAYGASGVQPGTIDAVQYYSSSTAATESGEEPALVFSTLGNRNLKPERSEELELGLDGTFWDNRVSTEVTYYTKKSKDALISRILPPSIGTGATSRLENLGEVRNTGWEFLVNARLMDKDAFGWDITLNGSTNDNELVSLGGVPDIIGTTQSQREGYPLYGWWSRKLTGFGDKNGDGIIVYNSNPDISEITVTDTAVFQGYSMPTKEFALINGIDLWRRRIRVSAMLDYKGGHLVYNNTERIRCASRFNCEGLISPTAPLFEQARTVMVREHPSRSVSGFFEKGDFIRFRELSVSLNAPDNVARWFRSRSVVASLAARNLGILWTDFLGVDPEAFGSTGDAPSIFQSFGPPTYFAFRLSLGY